MIRTPLSTISAVQKGLISGAHGAGLTPGQIRKLYNVPQASTHYLLEGLQHDPTGNAKPRSGRPKSMSVCSECLLLWITRLNPKITYAELKHEVGLQISWSTIYQLLGIINWLLRSAHCFTPAVAGKRYAWATAHASWIYNDWAKIILSDECSVERGAGAQRQWAFRLPDQKWQKEMIQPYKFIQRSYALVVMKPYNKHSYQQCAMHESWSVKIYCIYWWWAWRIEFRH